jgi:hypothetical protein
MSPCKSPVRGCGAPRGCSRSRGGLQGRGVAPPPPPRPRLAPPPRQGGARLPHRRRRARGGVAKASETSLSLSRLDTCTRCAGLLVEFLPLITADCKYGDRAVKEGRFSRRSCLRAAVVAALRQSLRSRHCARSTLHGRMLRLRRSGDPSLRLLRRRGRFVLHCEAPVLSLAGAPQGRMHIRGVGTW